MELAVFARNVASDHLGIHAVGFTAPADALSVAAQITRVNHEHLHSRPMPELREQLLIAACRFHPQTATARHCSQPRENGFALVGNALWPKRTCSARHHYKTAVYIRT